MTIERAMEILDPTHRERYGSLETVNEACRMGQAALEKQLPKTPQKDKEQGIRFTDCYICPSCRGKFTGTGIADFCYHCGQALDWETEHFSR